MKRKITKKRKRKNPCLPCLALNPKTRISNPRFSRYREALKVAAKKFDDFDEFANAYLKGASRGTYWVGVTNENFTKEDLPGSYVAYISPIYIDDYEYAVEINAALLDADEDFKRNLKDPKNSVKITNNKLIFVNYVYPIKKAVQVWLYNARYLPNSLYQLKQFWEATRNEEVVEMKAIKHKKRVTKAS